MNSTPAPTPAAIEPPRLEPQVQEPRCPNCGADVDAQGAFCNHYCFLQFEDDPMRSYLAGWRA